MPALNTDTSVVDYIKNSGGDSSFSGRASKAVELGLVKSPTEYVGSAEQNTSLLNALQGAAVKTTPTAVKTMGDASSFINSKQDEDIVSASKTEEPPVRNVGEDLKGLFNDLTGKSSLIPTVEKPVTPNYEQTYLNMRKQYGVDVLDSSLNDLNTQADEIRAQFRVQKNAETGKPVAMNVIEGRVSEEEKAASERLDVINNSINTVTRQLNAANTTIQNVMNFKKLDYDTAKSNYDTEFSNNITLFNTIKGVYDTQLTENDRAQDSARSNLQIIYNSMQDGQTDFTKLDAPMKAKIGKMELEAGLPVGFYQTLQAQKPAAKILSTTTRTTGGKKYADIIYQNKDGSLTTSQVYLGGSNEGNGSTESDLERDARAKIVKYFDGLGGKVNAAQYVEARKAWVADVKGATASEFDDIFSRDYLDKSQYDAAGVVVY